MELKKTFIAGLMNKDFDSRLIPEGEYIDAENIIVSNSESSSVGLVQKSNGLDKLTELELPTDAVTIGSVTDEGNECIYWFVTSSVGNFVYEYDVLNNNALSILLQDDRPEGENILNFSSNHKITGCNVVYNSFNGEKLIIWTDDLNPIRCINVNRAKSYTINGFDDEDISLYKKAPYEAPKCSPTIYGDGSNNNIKERFFSFGYRYKYLDGEYSPISALTNPQFQPSKFAFNFSTQENDGMINSFNAVNINFNTGSKNVTDIQLVFKESSENNIYVIENFNKKNEGYNDNVTKSFLFSNNKIYSILPQDEINRLYDNIPILAKSQEFIGNRVIFGNYTEGRDLVDINDKNINVNLKTSFTSKDISNAALTFLLSTTTSENDTIEIDFDGEELVSGKILMINFRSNSLDPYFGNYICNLPFYLDKNYTNAYQLSISDEFVNFINNVASKNFENFDLTNNVPTGKTPVYIPFQILSSTSSSKIKLKIPYIQYVGENEYYHIKQDTVSLYLSEGNAFSSCKSIRSYETGIVYLDKEGRYSTVLTSKNNNCFIPISKSYTKNNLVVEIKNKAPKWADRYKIFVKDSKLSYQTIYGVFAYKDQSFLWIKLEGQDKQKVKEGDYLIIKRKVSGVSEYVEKLQVLDYKVQSKDFISGNKNPSGEDVIEREGVYIKVKATGSLNIDGVEKNFYDLNNHAESNGDYFFLYSGPFSVKETVGGVTTVKDIAITPGSYIDLSVTTTKYGSSGGHEEYIKKFTSAGSYDNFQDWFTTEGDGLGKFKYEFIRKDGGMLYLKTKNLLNGNGQHPSYMDSKITITTGISLLIFETDPKDNNSEVFFETQDTYKIVNGNHLGILSTDISQSNVVNTAKITLDWFNCYSQGNGAESYIVKDVFNKNFLSTNSRPNAVQLDGYKERRNVASLTYSGAFDKTTNYNSLNEFNLSRANYKDLDDKYGSIQKLHSRDTDLIVFQEDKVHRVLYNKNVLADAVGGGQISSIEQVLGQEIPFSGEWGISKSPESFSYYANSIYFTDTNKGVVLRLGGDGLEPISKYKMRDWFKDNLRTYKNNFKYGGYDPVFDNYVLSLSNDSSSLPNVFYCDQLIQWLSIPANSELIYNINIGSAIGNHILEYKMPIGTIIDFQVNFNGEVFNYYNITGQGSISIPKHTIGKIGVIKIINNESTAGNLSIVNKCAKNPELEVILLVVNDNLDVDKSMINSYSWSNSTSNTSGESSITDVFDITGITRYEKIIGEEGFGSVPLNNSSIRVNSIKQNGTFTSCNRIGYKITGNELTPQEILDQSNYPTITNIGDENYIEFEFIKSENEKLYLIWDYIDEPNCDVTPYEISLCYDAEVSSAACDCNTVPTCPDKRVVFQICNSNSAKDDNFDIYLNNQYIGNANLNSNSQVGSVFIADTNTNVTLGSSDFVCPLSLMTTYHFDPAILLPSNTLEMRNTQNNGNGNFGEIGMRNYTLSGTTLTSPCVITNLQYSGASGESFTFNFDYTQCCV